MSDGAAYTPTADQHRERARLLRYQAEAMSAEGKRLFLNIADEFDVSPTAWTRRASTNQVYAAI